MLAHQDGKLLPVCTADIQSGVFTITPPEMLQLDQKYCIISGQPMQENGSSLAVIFIPFFTYHTQGDDTMNQRYGYGYVRVSTDKQEELSPDSQEKLLREYAKKNHIVLLSIYQEIGISGRKADKRPEFQKMIASAKSKDHPVDVILVWKFSRFARSRNSGVIFTAF